MEKAGPGGWCEDFIAWSNKSYLYYQGGPDGVGKGLGALGSAAPVSGTSWQAVLPACGRGTSECGPCSAHLVGRDLSCHISPQAGSPASLSPLFVSLSLQELVLGRSPSVVLKVCSADSMLVALRLAGGAGLPFISFEQL